MSQGDDIFSRGFSGPIYGFVSPFRSVSSLLLQGFVKI